MLKKNPDGCWIPASNQAQDYLEFELGGQKPFDCLELKEDMTRGQRIESFRLEAWVEGKGIESTKGTTVGHKRLLTFPAVTTDQVRLTILQSRGQPCLKAFNLYKLASFIH
ncbi:MAG: discoidin domain-containing protein [Candidatus Saccharicenans sp.]|nr:discoidin domain-containing protein [Candidatus Saccharicenans sp.]MDH7492687.1 discoidin domain-containing protein [Candidatus Saccharicenans sp.]